MSRDYIKVKASTVEGREFVITVSQIGGTWFAHTAVEYEAQGDHAPAFVFGDTLTDLEAKLKVKVRTRKTEVKVPFGYITTAGDVVVHRTGIARGISERDRKQGILATINGKKLTLGRFEDGIVRADLDGATITALIAAKERARAAERELSEAKKAWDSLRRQAGFDRDGGFYGKGLVTVVEKAVDQAVQATLGNATSSAALADGLDIEDEHAPVAEEE